MRQPSASAPRRTHQTIKIKEKDAPDREVPASRAHQIIKIGKVMRPTMSVGLARRIIKGEFKPRMRQPGAAAPGWAHQTTKIRKNDTFIHPASAVDKSSRRAL
ncbi:MAG: hypothetical protein ACOYA9_01675 [Bilifractor sp.]|jgi:hypothetical protein